MTDGEPFMDYYNVLQVHPDCDAKILESAYRHLAKTYHPDRPGTGDPTKFAEVIAAYRVLRNPQHRAEYHRRYSENATTDPRTASNEITADDMAALNDSADHYKILAYLYRKRREQAQNAGVAAFYLQDILNCSDERFEFHQWYLKERGFISITEQGTLAITVQGVDHVISTSRTARAEKLLITQTSKPED